MKAKAEQYQIKLSDIQMLDVLDNHEKLTNTEEIRANAEFKVEVEALK